ncbi:hypothetical protein AB6A40_006429, partial [Gnathostoma spinigerum]
MVGRSPNKRSNITTPSDLNKTPVPVCGVSSSGSFPDKKTVAFGGLCSVTSNDAAHSSDFTSVDRLIKRYISTAQYKTAVFWADKRLSMCRKDGRPPSYVDMAEFLNVLTAVGDWPRILVYSKRHDLPLKHLVFAYYYVNALFKKNMYLEIQKLKLGNLIDDPTMTVATYLSNIYKTKMFMPKKEEVEALDSISQTFKMEGALLLLLGKTYLILQNRLSAQKCLHRAVLKDPCLVEAMELIQKYNLLSKKGFEDLINRAPLKSCGVPDVLKHFELLDNDVDLDESTINSSISSDLSIRTSLATRLYRSGNVAKANRITSEILNEAGIFQDCLLVHVATLVHLRKADELFSLAHQLVDNQPDNELSWYTVGCYYYTIGQLVAAKNFLNKCTSMNSSFGEGWLAFGHVLSAESEHEQAMNCYLRASRVLEGSFEPLMYIGLEYSYANNTRLAQDFLNDASELAGKSVLVMHEQGCIYYMKKDWRSADVMFSKALRLLCNITDENCDAVSLLDKPLSTFWEPLINNLGHVRRKLHSYMDSVKFHQKSLSLCPHKASTIGAMAISFASAGKLDEAARYFHEALGICPHSQILKQALERLLELVEVCVSELPAVPSIFSSFNLFNVPDNPSTLILKNEDFDEGMND